MKLFFFPAFLFAIFQSFFFKETPHFWSTKLKGTLLGIALIPTIFYLYNGIVGKSPDWFNIAIFFISAGLCYLYEGIYFKKRKSTCVINEKVAISIFVFIAILFVFFTFFTPTLAIFKDPIFGTYGI